MNWRLEKKSSFPCLRALTVGEGGDPSSARGYWLLFGFAALSFLLTLPVEYIGQESVYPLMSYEMWFYGKYLAPSMYGVYYWRPPLYNLMIVPVAQLMGWNHMLVAARLVALTATISSALLLAWFVRRQFGDKTFAAFTALIYLTLGDVLFYRGWLCDSEPVFGLFVLVSVVFVWLALAENRYTYLAVAVLAVSAAFLSKVLTAYVFYVIAMIVVAYRRRNWAFLYSWRSLLLNGLAVAFPLFWYRMVPAGHFQSHGMIADITSRLVPVSGGNYLKDVLAYAMQTLLLPLPVAGVLLYAYIRRQELGKWRAHPVVVTVMIIVLANYLPYLLSPQSDIRYVFPLLPFIGLTLAYLIFYGAPRVREWSLKCIIAAIVLKFAFGLLGFPFFHQQSRASFEPAAKDILRIVGNQHLYATNMSGSALSIVSHIDILIYPKAPLTWPPAQFNDGFVISCRSDENIGTIFRKYSVGQDEVYLRCKGTACPPH
ncbi:MAG: dolichyl-phosphate-mannose--protein mannosyltransferase [Dissulfurispiraceae bacterium]|jgi:4-amino-4-deoxy-L-arabinose transferase-like glycosyltransferase